MDQTQKSETTLRDKPKHSLKHIDTAKKEGAGGKGTYDIRILDDDSHRNGDQEGKGYRPKSFVPTPEMEKFFANGMRDLTLFKRKVRGACEEFMVSLDTAEFIKRIQGLEFSLYHQDLPAILIKCSLDRTDTDRLHISSLLHALVKENVVTIVQMTKGFRKLFNVIDELCVDAPNARVILAEFVGHGRAAGYLDSEAVAAMEREAIYLSEPEKLIAIKKNIKETIQEFFVNGEFQDFISVVQEVPDAMHFEVVKQLGNMALDKTDREREMANVALANMGVSADQMVKGFSILLSRVEDIYLDVPKVSWLMSCLLARAVSDEALPPAFLLRLDLAESDFGFRVAQQAQTLLKQQGAASFLANVWGQGELCEDDYCQNLRCFNRVPCSLHPEKSL